MQNENTSNPAQHTAHVKKELRALINHLRSDIEKLKDPSAKALFETSAEVLTGLEKAFTDYEEKKETAWRN